MLMGKEMSELKPVTYIYCKQCNKRIPIYEEDYVAIEIKRGGQVRHHEDLCKECAKK